MRSPVLLVEASDEKTSLVLFKEFSLSKSMSELNQGEKKTSDLSEFSLPSGDLLVCYCCYLLLTDSISPHPKDSQA